MSGHHINDHERPEVLSKSAIQWFACAGLFAAAVTAFLINADYRMSHSTAEKELSATLYELRTAQASLPARATDQRQIGSFDSVNALKKSKGLVKSESPPAMAVPITTVK